MSYRLKALLAVLPWVLTGCAVGPDYVAPEMELPVSFSNESGQQDVDLAWWNSFEDDTLTYLIEEAVRENKDVKQALSRINQSRALAREARSELYPGIQLGSAFEKSRQTGSRFPGAGGFRYEIYTADSSASWEIDIFGRLRRNLESKNAEYAGQVASLHDTLLMVLGEVAQTYFSLRGAQAQLHIAQKNLDIQEDTLELVQVKFDTGVVSELDAVRAQSQLEQTRAVVPVWEAHVQTSIHRLSVLLGKFPKDLEADLEKRGPIPNYAGPATLGKPEELLRRRPDIQIAERALASYTAQIGVAVSELFPKLTFSGSLGVDATHFSDLTGGANTRGYAFGPSISWRPFDFGRIQARITAADERAKEALYAYEKQVLVALEDVESSLVTFSSQRRRKIQLDIAFASAQKAHELAREQYEEGLIDLLSVLEAQAQMLDVESALCESREQVSSSYVLLSKALGGGWQQWELLDQHES